MKGIDVIPDDVLLAIFDFYMIMSSSYDKTRAEAWQSLVHVCRRWRNLVFQSPCRLKLHLFCTPKTPVKDALDIWPALPLIIKGIMDQSSCTRNVTAALMQSNRVCEVDLHLPGSQLEGVLAAMQVSFPVLTELRLFSDGETPLVIDAIPDSFLGGSVPHLRILNLKFVLFPGLQKLLMSATHLVDMFLYDIPHSGYISPEAMVAVISVSSSLETLSLEFRSPQSRPDRENTSLPPPKRSILPILKRLYFKGVTEYLEELVTRIDTPQLNQMDVTLFNQIDFDTPRLAQFINFTPTLRALDEAHILFHDLTTSVRLRSRTSKSIIYKLLIHISCIEPDWQLSSIEQVCNSSLNSLSKVEVLYIEHRYLRLVWKNDAIGNTLWLELLLLFSAVKKLYLSKEFAPSIAANLQELVEARVTEVLPSLQNIFVEGLEPSRAFHGNIGQFVAARRLCNHPIAISAWN